MLVAVTWSSCPVPLPCLLDTYIKGHLHDTRLHRVYGEEVSIAGRIHTMRASGDKLRFYDLRADGARIQILADAR